MTEHHHDPNLILALAAGTEPASSPAAAGVSACTQCSADLAAQTVALAALASMPPASLEPDERSRLRAGVRAALHLEDEVDAETPVGAPARRRWRPVWGLATAAAVFLAIVVVPPAFRALSSGNGEAGFEAAALTTTTQAADGQDALTAPGDAGRSTVDSETIPVVPEADVGATTDAMAGDEGGAAVTLLPEIVLEDLSDHADELRSPGESGRILEYAPGTRLTPVADEVIGACREVVGDADGYPVAVTDAGGVPALVMAYPEQSGSRLVIQALADCRVLGSPGP